MSEKPKVHPFLDRAWAAGIFDGKAVIQATGGLMYLDSTEEALVRRFHDVIGCGRIRERERRSNQAPYTVWRWEISTLEDNREVILFVAPFLSPRKTRQCADKLAMVYRNPYWRKKHPDKVEEADEWLKKAGN